MFIFLGIIEKNCWQGLEDFFSALSKALFIECEEQIHPVIKRKSRRRRKGKGNYIIKSIRG